jgi:N-acetylated-alpha-linked acidic dipeptidase
LDLTALARTADELATAGHALSSAMRAALARGPIAPATADRVNRELRAFEQAWLHEAGIPGRPWFKHLLFAPRYTYAAMTLPGVTEAAEAGDWVRAREQVALLVAAGRAAVTRTDAARAALTAAVVAR